LMQLQQIRKLWIWLQTSSKTCSRYCEPTALVSADTPAAANFACRVTISI